MIKIKRLIGLIILLVALVGCSDENNDDTSNNNYEKQLEEAQKALKEAKKNRERLEERLNEANETSDLIEETQDETEDDENETNEENNENVEEAEENNTFEVERDIEAVVDTDLDNTTITELRINEDMSTDEERYIVLVDLEWDVQNSAGTTKEMLDMYSDHLASKVSENKSIHELVLFWTVPYHNESDSILKRAYENKDDGMYLEDEMKDVNVFD